MKQPYSQSYKEELISLMRSSKNSKEWKSNCEIVKKECNGYPDFWYETIVLSGLCDEVLGKGSSEIKITT